MHEVNVVIISDSSGGTAYCEAKTALSQFPDVKAVFKRYPFITTTSIAKAPLAYAKEQNAVIFDTLVSPKLNEMVYNFAKWNHLVLVDCLHQPVSAIKNHYHVHPVLQTGMVHKLTSEYFDKISAIEFATTNDDGRHPENIPRADIVILGPSRTSKSPLSLYLAQHYGYKVVNVPIGPQIQLPKQVYQVNQQRIFGLLNSVDLLRNIRRNRLRNAGLQNVDTPYTNPKNIQQELDYAKDLYQKLGCLQINVSNKSIEETSAFILEALGNNKLIKK